MATSRPGCGPDLAFRLAPVPAYQPSHGDQRQRSRSRG